MELTCPHCGKHDTPKLSVTPLRGAVISKGFHIAATCFHCDRYIKFVSKTPEALSVVDDQIKNLKV